MFLEEQARFIAGDSIDEVWLKLLDAILEYGAETAPRGLPTKELIPATLIVRDSRRCVLTVAARRLSYPFAVAEFLWIMAGARDLSLIEPYNRNMRRYSDDGIVLAGAYGPAIRSQLDYVTRELAVNRASRQAVLTIWKPNPEPSRDIPCTVSLQFLVRGGRVLLHASMRSSDAWLGLPYDVFTFANIQAAVAGTLDLVPGQLSLSLGSSHLYDEHWQRAQRIVEDYAAYRNDFELPDLPSGVCGTGEYTGWLVHAREYWAHPSGPDDYAVLTEVLRRKWLKKFPMERADFQPPGGPLVALVERIEAEKAYIDEGKANDGPG